MVERTYGCMRSDAQLVDSDGRDIPEAVLASIPGIDAVRANVILASGEQSAAGATATARRTRDGAVW